MPWFKLTREAVEGREEDMPGWYECKTVYEVWDDFESHLADMTDQWPNTTMTKQNDDDIPKQNIGMKRKGLQVTSKPDGPDDEGILTLESEHVLFFHKSSVGIREWDLQSEPSTETRHCGGCRCRVERFGYQMNNNSHFFALAAR